MDPTERFSNRALAYVTGRPSYPAALLDWLLLRKPAGSMVADIGAGTGIFSAQLAQAGYVVMAVEPSQPMRDQIPAGINSLSGQAENLPLPEDTFDLVTVAQAFHWFDQPKAIAEFARILKPEGKVALVWNQRDDNTAVGAAYRELVEKYRHERAAHVGPRATSGGLLTEELFVRFENPQFLTVTALLARVHSTSYMSQSVETDEGFTKLHDVYSEDGLLRLPQYTELYYGSPEVS